MIGRASELTAGRALLLSPHLRLLTLTGTAGAGKTRLAIEIAENLADSFSGGVVFVDLAPVHEPELLIPTIARAVGIRENGRGSLRQRLARRFRGEPTLLVLDNFEQLLAEAARIADLLTWSRDLKILLTSRAATHLRWECVLAVAPLSLPTVDAIGSPEQVAEAPAVALFVDRARAIDPNFALNADNASTVAQICVRLDGLPLAIELAVSRTNVLPPRALLSRLEQVLDAPVANDLPERHQTLKHAIDWSYQLLDSAEQALFRQLAVFVAGCTLEAAEAIAGGAALAGLVSLVDRNLVSREAQPNGESRFRMLETIRTYARDRLVSSGEYDQTQRRLAEYSLTLAESAEAELSGRNQGRWLHALEADHDNIREMLRWLQQRGEALIGLRLTAALWRFWFTRGYLSEGAEWLAIFLGMNERAKPALRATALNGAGALAQAIGDWRRATAFHEEALELRRRMHETTGIAVSLNSLGNLAVERGDYVAARRLYAESLALRFALGDERGVAVLLNNQAVLARDSGDWEQAEALASEVLARFRRLGDKQGIALSLVTLGAACQRRGDVAAARELLEESLDVFRELGSRREIGELLEVLAVLACERGHFGRAVRLFAAADALSESIGSGLRASQRPRFARHLEMARAQLGDLAYVAVWDSGLKLVGDDAVAYALAAEQDDHRLPPKSGVAPVSKKAARGVDSLTRREQEVLGLLAHGLRNREIAQLLVISERTAETHVCNILSKFGLDSRAQLTAWALRHTLAP